VGPGGAEGPGGAAGPGEPWSLGRVQPGEPGLAGLAPGGLTLGAGPSVSGRQEAAGYQWLHGGQQYAAVLGTSLTGTGYRRYT
jgi:hypothetical protein